MTSGANVTHKRASGEATKVAADHSATITLTECYERAVEARRIANSTTDPDTKADFFEVERRWLVLAHDLKLHANTTKNFAAEDSPPPFSKGQTKR
jgi:hypothetical protein